MSYLYDEYLHDHIKGVRDALAWMIEHKIAPIGVIDLTDAEEHDKSKYGEKEYKAYDDYFYGNKSRAVVDAFNYAWLYHIHHNKHHWQYWVLKHDDEPEEALEMPEKYVYEMIADWWSFSWKTKNLYEIFDWYDKHKGMVLHEKTRKLVENTLEKIKKELGISEGGVIEHHGIPNQKWGVRNGPPYPLNSNALAKQLYSTAKEKELSITKDVVNAARDSGSELYGLDHRLKTQESIQRKIETDSKEKDISISDAATSMKDLVRYTTISSDDNFVKSYEAFKESLKKSGYEETRCRNYFDLYNQGKVKHKSVQSVFSDPDGYSFEVQFQTPSSQDAKNKKIPIYEERRKTGLSEERKRELELQMEKLAEDVSEPKDIEKIKSH